VTAELNHIIVHSTDPQRSAGLLATVLGAEAKPQMGHFFPVETDNGVTIDFMRDEAPFTAQHCAFLVDDETFDAAHAFLLEQQVSIYADPGRRQPGEINRRYGGRGVYFDDPDGHLMELLTAPYST
jgi:catechol 2,3-dioxygenase-like lactoylglutathione lyase family enzyme